MESPSSETNSTVLPSQPWHEPHKILSMVIVSLTFLLGLPGNGLVLWVAGLKMRQTVNTTWFLHLTLADFMCCLSLPFSLTQVSLQGSWPYGWLLCKLIPSVIILNMFASIFLLTAISLDRCLMVLRPVWCQNHRTVRTASAVCCGVWVLSLVMCVPVFVYRETFPVGDHKICTYSFYLTNYDYAYDLDPTSPAIPSRVPMEDNRINLPPAASSDASREPEPTQYYQDLDQYMDDDPAPTPMAAIIFTRLVAGFLLPCVTMVSCYSLIIFRMHRTHRRSHLTKSHNKTSRVAVVVVTVFLVCWAPYHVFGVLLLYAKPGTPFEDAVVSWHNVAVALASANSCLNPFLYTLLGKDFRKRAKKSMKNILEAAFNEEFTRTTSCTPKQSI